MKKLKAPNIVTLAILTTLTIIFWVFFSVFRIFSTKPSTSIPQDVLEPISPILDSSIMSKIEQGVYIFEDQIPNTSVSKSSPSASSTPIPTISPTPSSSPSASPTASPSASPQSSPTALLLSP